MEFIRKTKKITVGILICMMFMWSVLPLNGVKAASVEECIQIVTHQFFTAANSCYMDGTDMMSLRPDEVYLELRSRMSSVTKGDNYSIIFFAWHQTYLNELSRLRGEEITNFSFQPKVTGYTKKDDIYTVKVEEIYTYTDKKRGLPSGSHLYYTLTVDATDWKITDISGSDVFYSVYYNESDSTPMNEKMMQIMAQLGEDIRYQGGETSVIEKKSPLSDYTTLYNPQKAVDYATSYWISYNLPNFVSYHGYGGDCMNYTSQSISAGFDGKMADFGSENPRSWYHYPGTENTGRNWAWTSVSRFYSYIMTEDTYGVFGTVIDIHEAKPGDVVHVDYTSNGSWDHAVVVTAVEDEENTNALGNILFTGHTADRLNRPLTEMGCRASFRAIRIGGMVTQTPAESYWVSNLEGERMFYHAIDQTLTKSAWEEIAGKWYYFDENGFMQTGFLEVGGKQYYLRTDGSMKTGWLNHNNNYYYFNEDGVMQTGFLEWRGTNYYLNEDGHMVTGEHKIGDMVYVFDGNGALVVGEMNE